jgi:AcrR family transcriptional regulator
MAAERRRSRPSTPAPEPEELRPPRARRTSAEVRRLILDAAQQLFAANGFRGTSTREIAQTAGVAEVLLFRNFGSKAELYSTAVVLPLTEFLDEWLARDWSEWDEQRTEQRQREFIAGMYEIVSENRGLIMSYLAMSVFEPELIMGLEHSQALDQALDRLADRAAQHLGRLGHTGPNARVGTRAVVGMIVAMALFRDFGRASGSRRPSRDAVIDEMTELVLHGSLHRGVVTPVTAEPVAARRRRPLRKTS